MWLSKMLNKKRPSRVDSLLGLFFNESHTSATQCINFLTDCCWGQISSKIVASTNEFIKLYYNNNTISLDNIRNKDILIISGFIIGLAQAGKAVVIDGIASTAAALIATSIEPKVKEYLLASHYDKNDIHKKILEEINIPSYLFLEKNCDDGTGAAMGMSLIDASLHVLNDMKTFGEAEVAIAQDGLGDLKQSKAIK